MIVTELYNTEGLGNQLWRYVVTRVIAKEKGYDFGIMSPEKFRARDIFEHIDFGLPVSGQASDTWSDILPEGINHYYKEELIRNLHGVDVSPADPYIWFQMKDNTKIDGHLQAMSYIKDHKEEISEWLKVEKKWSDMYKPKSNICIIHVRGGDYKGSIGLLPFSYYKNAMRYMKTINKDMEFYVVSDDKKLAEYYFEKEDVKFIGMTFINIPEPDNASHHIGGLKAFDYIILNLAENVIVANSTFSFWAAWTNKNLKNVVAPKYWFAYNHPGNFWSLSDSKVDEWIYIDREGRIS